MTDAPEVLIPHAIGPERGQELAEKLKARLPEAPVTVARTPEESRSAVADVPVVLTFSFDESLLDAATDLAWIQAMSAGVDHYPLEQFRERGVTLTNASGVHAEPIAEQVIGYLLAFERGIAKGIRQQERGVWERYDGNELRGKTLGIIGVGAIGTRIAELAQAFGMTVVGTKRDTSEVPDAIDEIYPADEHFELLLAADHVVLACPLTDETEGLIGTDELRTMDSDAILVNIARGEVIDEDALIRTLQQHGIGGAALDVFETEPLPADSPLWDLSNVIVSPHMAGSNPHYLDRCVEIFAANYEHFRAGDLDQLDNRVL